MEKIKSFQIDHTKLKPGLYISRVDVIGKQTEAEQMIITYDMRFVTPNKGDMDPSAMHTIEHLCATFLRNRLREAIIYFGGMFCLTGFYCVVSPYENRSTVNPERFKDHLIECMKYIIDFEGEIPGASEVECGNYKFHNLEKAKEYARIYLNVLENLTKETMVYPE